MTASPAAPLSRIALYPGSFDPVTRGHLDVARRAAAIFDEVVIAVGCNPTKRPLFTLEERLEMARQETGDLRNVLVKAFDGLLVNFVRREAPGVVLRGLRTVAEFDSEFQMSLMNRAACGEVETLFILPSAEFAFHSAHLIKELAAGGADLSPFLTPSVAARLKKRMAEKESA